MAGSTVNFGFSTCPNDTFAFHAWVHGLVPGPLVVPFMDDIEVLNQRAERGEAEVTKVSIARTAGSATATPCCVPAAPPLRRRPILVARERREVGGRIAIPGERTTAALLLRLLGRFETVAMR